MKVKLLVSRVTNDAAQNRGDVIDVSDAEAISIISAGQAEPWREPAVERAVPRQKAEKAIK